MLNPIPASISSWGGTRTIQQEERWFHTNGPNWTLAMRWIWPRECSLPQSVDDTNFISLHSRTLIIPPSSSDWMEATSRRHSRHCRHSTPWRWQRLCHCRKMIESTLGCMVGQFTTAATAAPSTTRNSLASYWKRIWFFHNCPTPPTQWNWNWNDSPRKIIFFGQLEMN